MHSDIFSLESLRTEKKEKRRMKCKGNKLTKARVLRKFVETLDLKLEKVHSATSAGGTTYWRLVRDHGGELCPLYAPNSFKIYTFSSRTVILDYLLNDIPWWYERWQEKDSSGMLSMRKVVFDNPLFGCQSLEEAMLKLDLLDSEKPKK